MELKIGASINSEVCSRLIIFKPDTKYGRYARDFSA